MRALLALIALVVTATACGGATGNGQSHTGGVPNSVSGMYVHRASPDGHGGHPAAGVVIAAYPRAITTAGPVMVDPPKPIAEATTDAQGRFVISVPGYKRVFVAPLHDTAYAGGKWATVDGGQPVFLVGCTRCMRPLTAGAASG